MTGLFLLDVILALLALFLLAVLGWIVWTATGVMRHRRHFYERRRALLDRKAEVERNARNQL